MWLIGRGVLCRRRAQYSASAGSSGDAPCLTVWCRTMLVQENLCMKAPLVRSPNTHRSCLALLNLPKYRVKDPGRRFVRVAEGGPLVGEPPQVVVQLAEGLGGYLRPVVGGPAPNDRVEPFDHRPSVGPAQGPQLGAQPFPDPSDGRFAGLDQQLAAVAADVEPEEVKALIEGDDTRLVLVEGQAPRRQPPGQPRLDLERFLPGVAERDEVVGLCRVAGYAELGSGSVVVAGFGG